MKTTLIFVRHGQSKSNLAKIFTGHLDTELTPLGIWQAEATAQFLKEYPITQIYASDLTRVIQTAEPTARLHHLPIQKDPALREIYAGDWEGKSYEQLKIQYPESYRTWLEDLGHACPDGGESTVALAARIHAEVERLLNRHRGECIALFSHATPARAMGCQWFGISPQDMAQVPRCANASVSVAEYDDAGTIRILCYGHDKHLGEHATTLPPGQV